MASAVEGDGPVLKQDRGFPLPQAPLLDSQGVGRHAVVVQVAATSAPSGQAPGALQAAGCRGMSSVAGGWGWGVGDRPGWLARFPTQRGMSSYRHLETPCWVIVWVQIPRQSVMLSLNSFFHLIRKMSMVFIGPFDETRNREQSRHRTGVLSLKAAVPCPSRTQL